MTDGKKVIIGGESYTVEEVKDEFAQQTILENPTIEALLSALKDVEKPLNRNDLAEQADRSSSYTGQLLKKLRSMGLVESFTLGGSRRLYYALTEEGYEKA